MYNLLIIVLLFHCELFNGISLRTIELRILDFNVYVKQMFLIRRKIEKKR